MNAQGTDTIILINAADIDRLTDALLETGHYVDGPEQRPILRAAVQDWVEKIVDDALDDPRWLVRHFGGRLDDCLERAERKVAHQ